MSFRGGPWVPRGQLGPWPLGPGPQNCKDSSVINCTVDCSVNYSFRMSFRGGTWVLGANWVPGPGPLGPGPQNCKDSSVINCTVDCSVDIQFFVWMGYFLGLAGKRPH